MDPLARFNCKHCGQPHYRHGPRHAPDACDQFKPREWVGYAAVADAELIDRLLSALDSRELSDCKEDLLSRLTSRTFEVSRVRALIDRDRTGLAAGLAKVCELVKGYWWLREEHGWASYEWKERTIETLRKEFGFALENIDEVASEALRESGQLAFSAFHPELDRDRDER